MCCNKQPFSFNVPQTQPPPCGRSAAPPNKHNERQCKVRGCPTVFRAGVRTCQGPTAQSAGCLLFNRQYHGNESKEMGETCSTRGR